MKRLLGLCMVVASVGAFADAVGTHWVAVGSEYERPHETFAVGDPSFGYRLRERPAVWIRLDKPKAQTSEVASVVEAKPQQALAKEATIYFPFGSYTALDASPLELLFPIPEAAQITVTGRTDSVGTVGYNQRLSEKRAQAVADDLERLGAKQDQIQVVGKGEKDPVASNATAAGRAKNRQATVEVKP